MHFASPDNLWDTCSEIKLRDYTKALEIIVGGGCPTLVSVTSATTGTVFLTLFNHLHLQIEVTNSEQNSTTVQVNLDPELLSLLKEVFYLADPPFLVRLPDPARLLLRGINDNLLRTTAARLETIVSRYNAINKNIQPNELALFERKLMKINEVCKSITVIF